jgi:ComF family protein
MSSIYLDISICRDVLGLFLPNLCLLCDKPLSRSNLYVCPSCWRSLTVFPDRTTQPLRPLRGILDRLWIGWSYDDDMRRIVGLFKYDSRPELAGLLVREWLLGIPHREELSGMDLLLPVPIHPARKRWRGFNQSERLALELGRALNLPVIGEEALRIVNTPSQTELDREERWQSVRDAFRLQDSAVFLGKNVLLVDDLATSGATLKALGSLLKDSGAASVSAAVMTSPLIDRQF